MFDLTKKAKLYSAAKMKRIRSEMKKNEGGKTATRRKVVPESRTDQNVEATSVTLESERPCRVSN